MSGSPPGPDKRAAWCLRLITDLHQRECALGALRTEKTISAHRAEEETSTPCADEECTLRALMRNALSAHRALREQSALPALKKKPAHRALITEECC
ncbi:hypothetical protein NDU88_004839 [Pleurodeles waltl]|uniref:Uncharacterized protein n=1 Tax=Pleurodeles waltl TaxID=8319 RepID=A0AAV7L5S5_PLEWA|nr:hypothetical protein NDU88_004839 [Pleurodeles waltl]